MSDERLRELERNWKESGQTEAEVPYLQERLRAGDLGEEQLELAAWVGYPPARLLRPQPELELESWVAGIVERGGPDVVDRVAFAAVWAKTPKQLISDEPGNLRQVLDACAAYLLDPSPAARARLQSYVPESPYGQPAEIGLVQLLLDTSQDLLRILDQPGPLVLREVGLDVGAWILHAQDPIANRLDPLDELRERRGEFSSPDSRLLSLRARAGDLVTDAVELLQLLRHPEAMELLGGESEESLRDLAERVGKLGTTRLLQLALAAAEECRLGWEARHPGDASYLEGLEALRAWCQDRSRDQTKRVRDLMESIGDHGEPPWALLRAGMCVTSTTSGSRAAHGALTWALSERIVTGQQGFDYKLVRSVSNDRPERLDPQVRDALGLADCETIFATQPAEDLLHEVTKTLIPLLLRSASKHSAGLGKEEEVEVVPVPRRWADLVALGGNGARDRLVERVQTKGLRLRALRTAAMLGSGPARAAAQVLAAESLAPPEDPEGWCDAVWACGSQAWGHAVFAYLEQEAADLANHDHADWPDSVRDWLRGKTEVWAHLKSQARRHLNGSGLDRYGQPIDDCDYASAHPDDLRAMAVLSLSRKRGFRYQRAAKAIGATPMREHVAREAIPCVLGYTRFPGSACPPGTSIAPYDPSATFAVGTWLHHATHGLGEVSGCKGARSTCSSNWRGAAAWLRPTRQLRRLECDHESALEEDVCTPQRP